MTSASSNSEGDLEASNERDPIPMAVREGTAHRSVEQGRPSQSHVPQNPEESDDEGVTHFDEYQPESLDRASLEEEEESQDETEAEDLNSATKEELDNSHTMFLLFRRPAIKILHSALKEMLLQMSPPLDADTATLEELRRVHGCFPMEKIISDFKKTIDDSIKNSGVDTPECCERRYKEITLVSKDVSFYAKILRVFFNKEYEQEKRYPALKKIVELRNTRSHCTNDGEQVTSDSIKKTLDEAELEVSNLRIKEVFPEKLQLLRSAREETAALNTRCSNCNVLTCMQQLQACESIRGVTIKDVFVSPLMMFKDQPLSDLSDVFGSDETIIGVCTGLRAVLMSGSCGVGKSTLGHRLVQSWLEGTSPHLDQFEIVLLVDMHRARHSDILSYLQDAMPSTMKELSSDNFIQSFSDLKVLLVIDGFDSRYRRRVNLLRDIRDKFKRSTALIITSNDSLSTAQHCFDSVGDDRRPVVKVIGFDSECCEHFANKVSGVVAAEDQRTLLSKKFELVMKHRQDLFPCQRESPLVASIIMSILLMNPNMDEEWFESTPKLCHTLFFYSRGSLKQNSPEPECPPNEYLDDEALLRLGEVCLLKLKSDGRLEFSHEDGNSLGFEKDSSLPFCLLKNETDNNSDAAYSLCSTSFMHYLAALYLTNDLQINERSLLSYFEHDKRLFKELLPFVVRDSYLLEKCSEEVFNIAVDVMRMTSYDAIYSFWYAIVSQMDHNTNNVFLQSVNQVLQSSEWSLDKETLVPAAGLLKLCERGVTQKLKITLTGSDSFSNGPLMQHLRECLRVNYSNAAAIILFLDLGLSDVEASCTWLEVLEEQFLRLVDFTAHVDAESVLMLRECQHLSSITLRLSSVDSFNNFTECYEVWPNLETVKLHMCFLGSLSEISEEQVKRLSNRDGRFEPSSFELIFNGLESHLLNKFFALLLNILPSNQDVFRIVLRNTTLNFADARKLLSTKFFVDGRLDVTSTCSLSAGEKDRLKAETFRDEDGLHQWPFFQFSWNGCHW